MADPGCWAAHPGKTCTRTAPAGYCIRPRCYCGACPWWSDLATHTPDRYTAYDRRAVLSSTGRRTDLATYRAAQAERRR